MADVDREELLSALNALDPSDYKYEQWTEIGMACQDGGLTLDDWDRWSSQDPRPHLDKYGRPDGPMYVPGNCATHWRSFTPGGGRSYKTIFYLAYQKGWKSPKRKDWEPDGGCLDWDSVIEYDGYDPAATPEESAATPEEPDDWEAEAAEQFAKEDLEARAATPEESETTTLPFRETPFGAFYETPTGKFKDFLEEAHRNVDKALDYLTGRGITLASIDRFKLGYVEKDEEHGIYKPSIVIPYSPTLSYYCTRTIRKRGFKKPKSDKVNIGDDPVFNPRAFYSGEPTFLTEAPLDAISIIQCGGNAASLIGTSGKKKLAHQFGKDGKPTGPIILVLDNDEPGRGGTESLSAWLMAQNIDYIVSDFNESFPEVDDPNTLLQQDPARLTAWIRKQLENFNPGLRALKDFSATIWTERYKPIPTKIAGLDKLLHGGLIPGTLTVIGAPPGSGKSALCTQLFENFARAGMPGVYLNLEMGLDQMLARSIARIAYTDLQGRYLGVSKSFTKSRYFDALDILQGYRMDAEGRDVVRQAMEIYRSEVAPLLWYNPESLGSDLTAILEYLNKTALEAREKGRPAPAVCLDYLQLISGEPHEDVSETIKRAVMGLKQYAVEYNTIAIVITAQSRNVNSSMEATQAAGRDSSTIEYSADLQLQLVKVWLEKSKNNMEAERNQRIKQDPDWQKYIIMYVTKSRFTASSMTDGKWFKFWGGQSYFEEVEAPEWAAEVMAYSHKTKSTEVEVRRDNLNPDGKPLEEPKQKARKRL